MMVRPSRSRMLLAGITLAVVGAGLIAYMRLYHHRVLLISVPDKSTWWNAQEMLAVKWGMMRDSPFTVKEAFWPTGKRALQSLLEDGSDLAFACGPPIVTAASKREPILVLAQAMNSRHVVHLLPRAEHIKDWLEHPIGLARGSISEFYLISHLKKIGLLNLYKSKKLTLVDRPNVESNLISLIEGSTKAIILFQPFAHLLTSQHSARTHVVDIADPEVYSVACYYVTTRERWALKKNDLLLSLVAFKRTEARIKSDPQQAWTDLKQVLDYAAQADAWGARDWNNIDLSLRTSKQTILADLTQDAEIGIEGGFYQSVPDFGESLAVLEEVEQHLKEISE